MVEQQVSGLSVVGRDKYGVFPLRGKLLNVREAGSRQVSENAEIAALKQIMGLQQNKEYNDAKSLRYGHIMIMTDQVHPPIMLSCESMVTRKCFFSTCERTMMAPISKGWS